MEKLWKIYGWTRIPLFLLFGVLFFIAGLSAQDKAPEKKKFSDVVDFNGYLKLMQTSVFSDPDNILMSSLIHNRLNFKIFAGENWTFKVDFRNRMIWGNYLESIPGFVEGTTRDNGLWNMSFNWAEADQFVLNTTVDRLWADYSGEKFSVRVGRQRINWGLNYVWNPNDLFNAYNYFDFDYEERPGADAVRMQFYPGTMSAIDVSIKPDKPEKAVYAGQYRFNAGGYDFQVLGGYFHRRATAGAGFAGNIGDAAIKFEGTWFGENDTIKSSVSAAVDFQYGFKNGLNLTASYLFNSAGFNAFNPRGGLFLFSDLSADFLMPSKHSAFGDVSYTFSPLIAADLGTIYTFGFKMLFLMPNFTLSLTQNIDLNLLGQVFITLKNVPQVPGQSSFVYIRFKWSF